MHKAAAAALFLLVSSCLNTPHYLLMDRSAYPVPAEEVDIFLPEDDIPEDCERIALLFASRNQHFSYEGLVNSLREDAGEFGANAIDIQLTSEAGTAMFIAPTGGTERNVDAIALYCPGETSTRRPTGVRPAVRGTGLAPPPDPGLRAAAP